MNKFDIVSLEKEVGSLSEKGIVRGYKGFVVSLKGLAAGVIFFNDKNEGEIAYAEVVKSALSVIGKLPKEVYGELEKFVAEFDKDGHQVLSELVFHEYDQVMLNVDRDEYEKAGVHKGMRGCVMSDHAVMGALLVDFSDIDEHGNMYGDCISVKMSDIVLVE